MWANFLLFLFCIFISAVCSQGFLGKFLNKISPNRRQLHINPNDQKHQLRIIIGGAPAAGKGTQCEMIKSKFGVIHLSTGEILRQAVADRTELGKRAQGYIDNGKLVPDELIIDVVCERLKQKDCIEKGWLLDGFPRTKFQAEELHRMNFIPDCFLFLDVDENLLVDRVCGRRTDPLTGKVYHITSNPPPTEEIAARCQQRNDDTPEKVAYRYQDFKRHITSILDKYKHSAIRINGNLPKTSVSEQIISAIQSVLLRK